jgi:hypothetical protein
MQNIIQFLNLSAASIPSFADKDDIHQHHVSRVPGLLDGASPLSTVTGTS